MDLILVPFWFETSRNWSERINDPGNNRLSVFWFFVFFFFFYERSRIESRTKKKKENGRWSGLDYRECEKKGSICIFIHILWRLSGVSLLSSRSVTRLRESCYAELSVGIMSTDDPAAVSQVFGYPGSAWSSAILGRATEDVAESREYVRDVRKSICSPGVLHHDSVPRLRLFSSRWKMECIYVNMLWIEEMVTW